MYPLRVFAFVVSSYVGFRGGGEAREVASSSNYRLPVKCYS